MSLGKAKEEMQELKRKLAAPHGNSDHSCLLNAVQGFTNARDQQAFCDENCLNQKTMRVMKDQTTKIFTELKENKTQSFANRHQGKFKVLEAVLAAGLYPNIAKRRGNGQFLDVQDGKVEASPHATSAYQPDQPDEWCFYQELTQVESMFKLKMVSPVS